MAITASGPSRRSLVEYLPALFIGALATIVVAAVALQSSGSGGPAEINSHPARWFHSQDDTPTVYIMYIVDSQEAAEAVRRSEDEVFMTYINTNQQPPNRTSTVLVARTPEEGVQAEQLTNLAALEMAYTSTIFEVADLRIGNQHPE